MIVMRSLESSDAAAFADLTRCREDLPLDRFMLILSCAIDRVIAGDESRACDNGRNLAAHRVFSPFEVLVNGFARAGFPV